MSDHELTSWVARWARRLLPARQARVIDEAAAMAAPGMARLKDIGHVVILMQENRSFDQYFGTMSAVRGFSDPAVLTAQAGGARHPVFDQFGYRPGKGADPAGYLQPFRLVSDPPLKDGQTTNDIQHDWPTQHRSWNGGRMDRFVAAHLAADGAQNGPLTMGYYTRQDLAFYYALADAFTVCDAYFSSVMGPTDANRVMSVSGSIDPDGRGGGPVVETYVDRIPHYGKLGWETMPERLQAAGVSWKVYNHPLSELALSPFPYFKAFADPFSVTGFELTSRALTPSLDDFADDVASGRLPAVSWLIPPLSQCEHPAAPPEYGEHYIAGVLAALVARPEVWAQTVLFVVHDENGGFFDHVPPPAAPEGTEGEWLTARPLPTAAGGIAGPVGLGFRVPCVVVSPFSRGGRVCPEVFDHTSLLRFIETRFGVEVPNLSAWRRRMTGDLTGALALGRPPVPDVPPLPAASLGAESVAEQAVLDALAGTLDVGIPYPLPAANAMPSQEPGPPRPPVPS
ncbi:MAG TPA: alkaline phosphatase family protein [Streptosporangiaceae bacterium]|nr:alkaline phosphatase family protein [Streptosporangiaceae bacterium]